MQPSNGKILITGGTGFIGGASATHAIQNGQGPDLLFLVRAPDPEQGLERIRESLGLFELAPELLQTLSADQILLGDLASPDVFVDDPRLDSVTHVLNCAAVASFGDHPGIWPVNVDGTVAFAARMARVAGMKRFLHVGTAMACGPGRVSPVHELWELDDAEHLVQYTSSKAEAERQMHKIPGLPLVVARPSIVVGHTTLGCKPSTSIFWVFGAFYKLQHVMCDIDDTVDVIPVDYCAQALMTLLQKADLAADLYHISAGARSSSYRDIENAFAAAYGEATQADRFRRIEDKDIPALAPEFKAKLGIPNRRLLVKALKLYGGFSVLNYQFDNQRLINEGMDLPPVFPSYIKECINSTNGLTLIDQMMDDFK